MTLRARLISFAIGCLLLAGVVGVALLANGGSTPPRPGPAGDRRDDPQRVQRPSRRTFPPLATRPTRPTQIGYIEHEAITESSGIVASPKRPGVLWTHCDSGNDAALYAITREGSFLAEYEVQARNDDWEDIAADDQGNLYIADTGNNGAGRKKVQVYRLLEPDPAAPPRSKKDKRLKPTFSWTLRYPASPFDCEAFFVLSGHGYLISKTPGIPAAIYRFALDEAKPEQVLERVCALSIFSAVTAADVTPDGKRMAVLSLTGLHIFPIDGDVARAAGVKPTTTRAVYAGIEAAAFLPDAPSAPGGVIVTSEGREIFLFPD